MEWKQMCLGHVLSCIIHRRWQWKVWWHWGGRPWSSWLVHSVAEYCPSSNGGRGMCSSQHHSGWSASCGPPPPPAWPRPWWMWRMLNSFFSQVARLVKWHHFLPTHTFIRLTTCHLTCSALYRGRSQTPTHSKPHFSCMYGFSFTCSYAAIRWWETCFFWSSFKRSNNKEKVCGSISLSIF